jgi:hypothetical protein
MKRHYPIDSSSWWTIAGMLAALLLIAADAKSANAGGQWGVAGMQEELEDNEVVFYHNRNFDEWGSKRSMTLAPGKRCEIVKVAFLFENGGLGNTTPRSIRLGKNIGVVLRNDFFRAYKKLGITYKQGDPSYRIIKSDVADLGYSGLHAAEAVLYRKIGSGEPPGAEFTNFPPNTLLQGTDCYMLFMTEGDSRSGETLRLGGLFYLTIFGSDTEVRLVVDRDNRDADRVLTTQGQSQTSVELSKDDLEVAFVKITAPPLVADTAQVADSGQSNIAGVPQQVGSHAVAAASSAMNISGKWEGSPKSVELVQNGDVVFGVVSMNSLDNEILQGTLTNNVLDFWFGNPNNLMSGQLTFAADGKTAQGYYQNASGGAKTQWVLKRSGG